MIDCKVLDNRIKVYDSYKVHKADIENALQELKDRYPEHCTWNRDMKSLKLEWAAHNLLYSWNIRPSKTKDVDLEYPQKWCNRFAYFILGNFALLVID